jgi:hypothetical protein
MASTAEEIDEPKVVANAGLQVKLLTKGPLFHTLEATFVGNVYAIETSRAVEELRQTTRQMTTGGNVGQDHSQYQPVGGCSGGARYNQGKHKTCHNSAYIAKG